MADNFAANPGAGGDTFAADDIGGVKFPRMKMSVGADGVNDGDVSSTNPLPVTFSTPVAVSGTFYQSTQPVSNAALTDVWNAVSHTLGVQCDVLTNVYDSFAQRLVVDASQVPIEANLTSAGSTKLVGHVVVDSMPAVAGSTTVDANLSSEGSTKIVGTVAIATSTGQIGSVALTSGVQTVGSVVQASGGSSATPWWTELAPGSSANIVGSVVLGAGSTGNVIGAVAASSGVILGAGSTANALGSVALLAGTSANTVGSVALVAGTSANTVGSVALVAGSSSNILGQVVLQAGTTANFQFEQVIPFSSGNAARTTVTTSVDISVVAANSARKALVIANLSTVQTVALGLTTAAVTTSLGGASLFLTPASQVTFGLSGGMPLFTGPIRGINITSTAVAGGVAVTEFS